MMPTKQEPLNFDVQLVKGKRLGMRNRRAVFECQSSKYNRENVLTDLFLLPATGWQMMIFSLGWQPV